MNNIALVLNKRSGTDQKTEDFIVLVQKYFPTILVFQLDELKTATECVDEALKQEVKTIVVAGGDGTISSVVSAIKHQHAEVRIAVLPRGTYNHFAKDLGIPLDLEAALQTIENGETILIDIVKLNDIYFINNSSLGLYPMIVRDRESRQRLGWSKRRALFATLFSLLRNHHPITIDFAVEERRVVKKTSFVFIGNNKYVLTGFGIGSRKSLDQGTLSLCIAHDVGLGRILVLAGKAFVGNIMSEKDFDVIGLRECIINSFKEKILVSYDGEVTKMKTPITYTIIPKALSVIVP